MLCVMYVACSNAWVSLVSHRVFYIPHWRRQWRVSHDLNFFAFGPIYCCLAIFAWFEIFLRLTVDFDQPRPRRWCRQMRLTPWWNDAWLLDYNCLVDQRCWIACWLLQLGPSTKAKLRLVADFVPELLPWRFMKAWDGRSTVGTVLLLNYPGGDESAVHLGCWDKGRFTVEYASWTGWVSDKNRLPLRLSRSASTPPEPYSCVHFSHDYWHNHHSCFIALFVYNLYIF